MTALLNVLGLFSGIGGLELGLERAGMTTVGQVEIDGYCRRVLAKHWPDVPRHDDVRTAVEWWASEQRPRVDLVCAGFPCQPVSLAGKRLAQDDTRWLWPATADVLRWLRPRYALMENVPGLFSAGIGLVLGELAELGFDASWSVLSACAVGAPHPRERVFILAHAEGAGQISMFRAGGWAPLQPGGTGGGTRRPWATEPDVGRVADGIPARVDRLRGLGNAVVPQVAEYVGRLIVAHAGQAAA